MRLIGGKDYYDGATWGDHASDRVFLRNRAAFDFLRDVERRENPEVRKQVVGIGLLREELPTYSSSMVVKWGMSRVVERRVGKFHSAMIKFGHVRIFFCGKVYRGAHHDGKVYWTREAIEAAVLADDPKCTKLRQYDRTETSYLRSLSKKSPPLFERVGEVIDCTDEQVEYAIQNNVVCATIGLAKVWCEGISPGLAGYTLLQADQLTINSDSLGLNGLQSVVPPVQANQEIDMWLGRFPASGPKTVEIKDDVVKRDKHGFDKMSFKKSKQR